MIAVKLFEPITQGNRIIKQKLKTLAPGLEITGQKRTIMC